MNATSIRVATLNVRNRSDRWRERSGLLVEQLLALQPDVIGLQEARRPLNQAAWLQRRVNARQPGYRMVTAWKSGPRRWWEGLAVLTRLPIVAHDRLPLGAGRVAQHVRLELPNGGVLDFYNTHLAHGADRAQLRAEQAQRILDWLEGWPQHAQVVAGDFNARPDSDAVRLLTRRLQSAHALHHGAEPERTVPTPLREHGRAAQVLDYLFVNERVTIRNAWVAFSEPAAHDARLTASDHYGVAADIDVTP